MGTVAKAWRVWLSQVSRAGFADSYTGLVRHPGPVNSSKEVMHLYK